MPENQHGKLPAFYTKPDATEMTSAPDKTDRRRKASGLEALAIKSASIDGLALVLRTTDVGMLGAELHSRFGGTALSLTPLLIDVSAIEAQAPALQLDALLDLARRYLLQPVGIVGARGALLDAALRLGLNDVADIGHVSARRPPAPSPQQMAELEQAQRVAFDQAVGEAVHQALSSRAAPTLVVTRPMRSGQRVYAEGGDLVVCSMVSHGAEVLADGHIHVYGPLRGRAIAGARGNTNARIFTSCMEPDLYAIAGIYNTTDIPLADDIHGKPAQVRLEGERLIVEPLRG
jgi:septum site-determining protein MinC